jgi:hypothetical protein
LARREEGKFVEPPDQLGRPGRSLGGTTRTIGDLVRGHRGIEKQVYWVLDVVFREDASRIRSGNAPQNMAVVRHMARNSCIRNRAREASKRSISALRLMMPISHECQD